MSKPTSELTPFETTGDERGSDLAPGRGLQQELHATLSEIGKLRVALADSSFQRHEQRLEQLEQSSQTIARGNDLIMETVRSFEALISIGLVQRINGLIEQRLTVISDVTARLDAARRRARLAWILSFLLGICLLIEIYYDEKVPSLIQSLLLSVQHYFE